MPTGIVILLILLFAIGTVVLAISMDRVQQHERKYKSRITELENVLMLCRPIVGGATAASGNEERPKRQAVYDRITVVLKRGT